MPIEINGFVLQTRKETENALSYVNGVINYNGFSFRRIMATAKGVSGKFVLNKKLILVQNLIQNNRDESLKSGRRVVELGYLADNLKCSCGSLLHLKDTRAETVYDLGSIIHVKCLSCERVVNVSTGKSQKVKRKKTDPLDVLM